MVCLWLAQHVGMFQSKGMRKVTIRLVAMEQNRPKMALMAWEIGPLGPLGPNGLGSKPPSHGGHMPLVIWCKLQHFWIYESVIYSHIFLSLTKPIRLASPLNNIEINKSTYSAQDPQSTVQSPQHPPPTHTPTPPTHPQPPWTQMLSLLNYWCGEKKNIKKVHMKTHCSTSGDRG